MNRLLPAILVAVGALQPRLVAQPAHAPTGTVTFARDVAPILYRRCATCHRPDGAAPFSLLTFEDARRRGSQMAAVTASRYMPPWKPEPGFGDFAGERRLSDAEIATIDRWVKGGLLEGNPVDLPPVYERRRGLFDFGGVVDLPAPAAPKAEVREEKKEALKDKDK